MKKSYADSIAFLLQAKTPGCAGGSKKVSLRQMPTRSFFVIIPRLDLHIVIGTSLCFAVDGSGNAVDF